MYALTDNTKGTMRIALDQINHVLENSADGITTQDNSTGTVQRSNDEDGVEKKQPRNSSPSLFLAFFYPSPSHSHTCLLSCFY